MAYVSSVRLTFLLACVAVLISAVHANKKRKVVPVQSKKSPPTFRCPKGYEPQEKGMCVRQISSPPFEACHVGEPVEPGKCLLQTNALLQCPPGFQKPEATHQGHHHHHGSEMGPCTAVEVAPMISECPPNAVPADGLCVIKQEAPMQMVCPVIKDDHHHHNQHDSDGNCFEFDSVPPFAYCASGTPLKNGLCEGVQMAPCPIKMPADAPPTKKGAVGRLLNKHKKRENVQLCERPIHVTPDLKCPEGTIESRGRHGHGKKLSCVVPREVPLVPLCPLPGGVVSEDGASCVSSTPIEALAACPNGFSECQKRGIHHFSGKCCRVDVAPPLMVCPPNFELVEGRCIMFTEAALKCNGKAMLVNGSCIGQEIKPAIYEYTVTVQPPAKKA